MISPHLPSFHPTSPHHAHLAQIIIVHEDAARIVALFGDTVADFAAAREAGLAQDTRCIAILGQSGTAETESFLRALSLFSLTETPSGDESKGRFIVVRLKADASQRRVCADIVSEAYHLFPGTTLTVCARALRNGYMVIGESAVTSPENPTVTLVAIRSEVWKDTSSGDPACQVRSSAREYLISLDESSLEVIKAAIWSQPWLEACCRWREIYALGLRRLISIEPVCNRTAADAKPAGRSFVSQSVARSKIGQRLGERAEPVIEGISDRASSDIRGRAPNCLSGAAPRYVQAPRLDPVRDPWG